MKQDKLVHDDFFWLSFLPDDHLLSLSVAYAYLMDADDCFDAQVMNEVDREMYEELHDELSFRGLPR